MNNKYSLIIIGAGMTGLSTALAWLKTHDSISEPLLILEKEPTPGGCVTTFAREGYLFDTVQIIPDISDLLEFYGIEMNLAAYEKTYARLFLADSKSKTAKVIPIASGRENFEEVLISRYSEDEKKIRRFFKYGRKLLDELEHLKTEPTPFQGLCILIKCPRIVKQSFHTYKDYLHSYKFKNHELIEVLDLFSSFSNLSGNRCAALLTTCAMMTTVKGSFRPRSGFIQFPRELKKKVLEFGGEIKTSASVDSITTRNGKVTGVLCGGTHYSAEYVVSTADTFQTINGLLDTKSIREKDPWLKKFKKAEHSPSSFTIHLGLDNSIDLKEMGFDCGYNVLTTGRKTHEKAFDLWKQNKMLMSDSEFHLAVISPSAMTGGKNNLIIHVTPAAMGNWSLLRNDDYNKYTELKNKTAEFYINKVEEYMIPNLKKHIKLTNISTPATYERYLGTSHGANNDMLSTPGNFGMFRLPTRTPVKGLFLPKFSHGIWPCLQAGLQVVDMISGGRIMNGNSKYHSTSMKR